MTHMPHDGQMPSLERIVKGGFCIGCGVCNCAAGGAIPIAMDQHGQYQAVVDQAGRVSEEAMKRAVTACPFSDAGPNEDELGRALFQECHRHDPRIGYFRELFIGHAAEDDFRATGTSGGVITWLLTELLRQGKIDAAVHVVPRPDASDGILFRYGVSETAEEIRAGAKSRYYPVEMSNVLAAIKQRDRRYAVVGLPCFIKALRRLADEDPVIRTRIAYHIGIVCGHLKSKAFADCFGWEVGIPPGRLEAIDFRVKRPGYSAADYGVYLRGAGREVTCATRELLVANWGCNFFRYSACDYCDDVFAETADAAMGDAWLPEYERDYRGTSVIVLRNETLHAMCVGARDEGRLKVEPSTCDRVAESQAGGLRDRRDGLAYRLYLKGKQGAWTPRKRVQPVFRDLSPRRRRVYRVRSMTGRESHELWVEAVRRDSFAWFAIRAKRLIGRCNMSRLGLARHLAHEMRALLRRVRSARLGPPHV